MSSSPNDNLKAPYLPLTEDELRERKARAEMSDAERVRDVFVTTEPKPPVAEAPIVVDDPPRRTPDLKIYSHSSLVYWWPVWLVGFLMAGFTKFRGEQFLIGDDREWFHQSSNLGVLFFATLIFVILVTNVAVRGLASGIVLLTGAVVSLSLAMLGWWDPIFAWFGDLKIHMNYGAYFWFSTVLFGIWFISTFIIDRLSYWHFTPGQVTREVVFGAGSTSFDTNGMVFEKHREDLFRHWLLGLGSGDLEIRTTGATHETLDVHNVFFIGSKINRIQRLIAQEPEAS